MLRLASNDAWRLKRRVVATFRSKNRKNHKESLKNSIVITNNELVIQAPAGRKSSVVVAALERIREQTLWCRSQFLQLDSMFEHFPAVTLSFFFFL